MAFELPFFALDALAPEAVAATDALATGLLAEGAVGAGMGMGMGIGEAAGAGIANAFPTVAETAAQASPQALAQLGNASAPGLQGLSPAQIQDYVGSNPYLNAAYAGQGTQVANSMAGIPSNMFTGTPADITSTISPLTGGPAAAVGASPEALQAEQLAGAGLGFGGGVVPGTAATVAPVSAEAMKAATAPGMFDKSRNWHDSLSGLQKAGLGVGASLAAQTLLGKKDSGPAATGTYSGPLSKFKYDPYKYTPLTVAQPTPYKAAYHAYAAGGPVEAMSHQNAIGANTGFPMADINHAAYATPYQQPISQNVLSGPQDTRVDPYTGEQRFAAGGQADTSGFTRALRGSPGVLGGLAGLAARQGMAAPAPTTYGLSPALAMFRNLQAQRAAAPQMPSRPAPIDTYADYASQMAANRAALARPAQANIPVNPAAFSNYNQAASAAPEATGGKSYEGLAAGGLSHLGSYSDGGRMLKGPGDGMSDDIPATIAGKQPARLANDEFVVPADVVSHLGNGSSDAGAKRLYAMMDRVRQARTGTKKQGKQINPDKYLPK